MVLRPPDLSCSLVADLPRGRLASTGTEARLVALPAEWLGAVLEHAPGALAGLARDLAGAIVRDARIVLEPGEDDPAPDDVAYAVSVAFATRGLGLASLERWGHALAFVWRDPPARSEAFREFASHLAAQIIGTLCDLDVDGAVMNSDEDVLRVLLGHPEACAHARELARRGLGLGAILDRLAPPAEVA